MEPLKSATERKMPDGDVGDADCRADIDPGVYSSASQSMPGNARSDQRHQQQIGDILCVHYWGAITEYLSDDGWKAFRICMRCEERWRRGEVDGTGGWPPEPETVIAKIRLAGT